MAKKLIALFLVCVALFTVVACNTGSGDSETTDDTQTTQNGTQTGTDDIDVPPLDYDFDGKEFEFGAVTTCFNGYDYRLAIVSPEGSADIVDVAVLDRNTWVEDNLNCKITVGDIHYGNWNTLLANILSGDCTFESMFMQYDFTCNTYIAGGYFSDMKRLSLNWNSDYWNPEANETLELLGKQYCAVSDISYMSFYGYPLIAFSTTVAEELLVTDQMDKTLYQTVLDDEWTLDYMVELGKKVIKDIDGGGIDPTADRFGIICNASLLRSLMVAGGYNFVQVNDEGVLESAVGGKGFESYFSKLFDMYTDTELSDSNNTYTPFMEDRLLFFATTFPASMREYLTEGDYGFLPMPKSTEAQERYLTPASMWNGQLLGLPVSTPSSNYEFISVVLNAMAYKSYTDVNDAFYNYALNYKHAQDDESIEMLRIIRDGIVFDYAIAFNFADCCDVLDKICIRGINTFASTYNGMKDAMDAEIKELMEQIRGRT